jgi:hypothetical protein
LKAQKGGGFKKKDAFGRSGVEPTVHPKYHTAFVVLYIDEIDLWGRVSWSGYFPEKLL